MPLHPQHVVLIVYHQLVAQAIIVTVHHHIMERMVHHCHVHFVVVVHIVQGVKVKMHVLLTFIVLLDHHHQFRVVLIEYQLREVMIQVIVYVKMVCGVIMVLMRHVYHVVVVIIV